jgi:hypothetical protein
VALEAGPILGTKPESVDAQKGTMLDIFVRCLKKEICMSLKEEFTANIILVVTLLNSNILKKAKVVTL